MLKFPPVPGRNKAMSYTNSCISEYLSCHIFESLGFEAQQTMLGTYTDKRGKEKTVVACRDFAADGKKLMLWERKEKILDYSMDLLLERNRKDETI